MLHFIPLLIILLCVAAIAVIIVRKFPQLSNLNVHDLPQEKESRKKKELLAQRFEMRAAVMKRIWEKRFSPLRKLWGQLQLKFRIYVGKVERLWHHEQMKKKQRNVEEITSEERRQKVDFLVKKAEESFVAGSYETAEELFIQAISLDQKSVPAYRGLGDTYLAKGALDEARQTYRFLLQLAPTDDLVMVKLAAMEEEAGNIEQAISWYQQAVIHNDVFSPYFYHLAELLLREKQPNVALEAILQAAELEPKNPKYLDLLVETAILCRNKVLADNAWNDLRLVNPDNNKLDSLKAKIMELE